MLRRHRTLRLKAGAIDIGKVEAHHQRLVRGVLQLMLGDRRVEARGLEVDVHAPAVGAHEPVVAPFQSLVIGQLAVGEQLALEIDEDIVGRGVPAVQAADLLHAEHAHGGAVPAAFVAGEHLHALDLLDRGRRGEEILIHGIRLEGLLAAGQLSALIAVILPDRFVEIPLRAPHLAQQTIGVRPGVLGGEEEFAGGLAFRPSLHGVGNDKEIDVFLAVVLGLRAGSNLKEVRRLRHLLCLRMRYFLRRRLRLRLRRFVRANGACQTARAKQQRRQQERYAPPEKRRSGSFHLFSECPHHDHSHSICCVNRSATRSPLLLPFSCRDRPSAP